MTVAPRQQKGQGGEETAKTVMATGAGAGAGTRVMIVIRVIIAPTGEEEEEVRTGGRATRRVEAGVESSPAGAETAPTGVVVEVTAGAGAEAETRIIELIDIGVTEAKKGHEEEGAGRGRVETRGVTAGTENIPTGSDAAEAERGVGMEKGTGVKTRTGATRGGTAA